MASLAPNYSVQASAVLDVLESGMNDKLLNAVCDGIDLICDHPGDRRARAEQLRSVSGTPIWKVPIWTEDDWVVLWQRREQVADIHYIGLL